MHLAYAYSDNSTGLYQSSYDYQLNQHQPLNQQMYQILNPYQKPNFSQGNCYNRNLSNFNSTDEYMLDNNHQSSFLETTYPEFKHSSPLYHNKFDSSTAYISLPVERNTLHSRSSTQSNSSSLPTDLNTKSSENTQHQMKDLSSIITDRSSIEIKRHIVPFQ
jgi:hypothetical protein